MNTYNLIVCNVRSLQETVEERASDVAVCRSSHLSALIDSVDADRRKQQAITL